MAQKGGHLLDLLKNRLRDVISQKEELKGSINAYVDKVTSPVKAALETQITDVKTFSEMNSELEKILLSLLEFRAHVEGIPQDESCPSFGVVNPTDTAHMTSTDRQVTDRQFSTRLDKIEESLSQMETKYINVMTQADSRMDKIEKRVKKMETGGKQDVSRLDKVVMDMETLKNQFGTSQQQLSKIKTLDDQVQKLTNGYSSLQNHGNEIQHLKKVNESLVSKMDTLAAKDDLDNVKEEAGTMKKSIEELSGKTDEIDSYLRKEARNTKGLARRISAVEPCMSKVEDVEKTLQGVTKKLTDIPTHISVIERKSQVPGFTAELKGDKTMTENLIIPFDDVTCNDGNNFMYDPQTGKLTAQRDGLYATSLTIRQNSGQGELVTRIVKFSPGGHEEAVSFIVTSMAKTSSCVVGVVRLKTGDQVYCQVNSLQGNVKISWISSFSCFMIGQ